MNVALGSIIKEVRAIMPDYPIGFGEATVLAEHQAVLLLKLLKIRNAPVDVYRVAELPGITVVMVPRYEMPGESGITCSRGGHNGEPDEEHVIKINQNNTVGQRRLTLAHEFKHILDDGLDARIYEALGCGNEHVRDRLIEKICDHFAAALLMPSTIIRQSWSSGIQEPETLANLCNVSTSAMIRRLRYLGFSNEQPKPPRDYFKRVLRARNAGQRRNVLSDTPKRFLIGPETV